jgi:hypothetical protein
MAWECEGKRLDKTLSAFGQHPRRNIIGDECPECNLSKAEVTGSTTIIGQPRRKLSPLYAIPVVLGIGGIAWANLTKPNSPPTDPVPTNPPPSTT